MYCEYLLTLIFSYTNRHTVSTFYGRIWSYVLRILTYFDISIHKQAHSIDILWAHMVFVTDEVKAANSSAACAHKRPETDITVSSAANRYV